MLLAYVIAVLIIAFLIHQFYWRRRELPPGPIPLPFVGNGVQLLMEGETFAGSMRTLRRKYGDVCTFWFGMEPLVLISDYETIKDEFVKKGDNYADRPPKNFSLESVHGGKHGIICTSGSQWRDQRRFALHVLRDFGVGRPIMEDRVLDETREFIKRIDFLMDDQECVNPYKPLQTCVGNIINAVIFGYRFDDAESTIQRIKTAIDDVNEVNNSPLAAAMMYPWTRKVPFIFDRLYKLFDKFLDETIGFYKKQIAEHKKNLNLNDEAQDFVTAYLQEMHKRKEQSEQGYFTEQQLLATVFDMWIAGLETTVTTLHWAFLYMLHFPEVQEKIHAELDDVIGREREVRMSDRNELTYLAAVVSEVQRMANVVPLNLQRVTSTDVNIKGYNLKAGTIVVPMISNVMYDDKLFPDPFDFKPERFVDSNNTLKKIESMVPFSIGKRSCLGESLARMELFMIFGNTMQKFRVVKKPGLPYPQLVSKAQFEVRAAEYECRFEKRD